MAASLTPKTTSGGTFSSSTSPEVALKHDVVIEGSKDASPRGHEQLARQLAERYGVDASVVAGALAGRRRMRLRAALDEAAAVAMKSELEALGARVALVAVDSTTLGALAGSPAQLTLSSLDGSELTPPPIVGPRTPERADAFAPPVAVDEELQLAVAPRRRGTLAPISGPVPVPPPPPPPPPRVSAPVAPVAVSPAPAPPRRALAADPRIRLGAGLAIGLAAGFLVAHIYASFAEDKIDDIRAELARQPPPQTQADYDLVMHQFDLAHERMIHVRDRIAVVAAVVWLVAGAGAAFAFWRLVPER